MSTNGRGRPPERGDVYEFHFYYRFRPGVDPPEWEAFLRAVVAARSVDRYEIMKAALLDGVGGAMRMADDLALAEEREISDSLDDMFGDF